MHKFRINFSFLRQIRSFSRIFNIRSLGIIDCCYNDNFFIKIFVLRIFICLYLVIVNGIIVPKRQLRIYIYIYIKIGCKWKKHVLCKHELTKDNILLLFSYKLIGGCVIFHRRVENCHESNETRIFLRFEITFFNIARWKLLSKEYFLKRKKSVSLFFWRRLFRCMVVLQWTLLASY